MGVLAPALDPRTVLFLAEERMEAPRLLPLAGGTAAVLSLRCPGSTSPNEDAAAIVPCADDAGALVVADGAGGMRSGSEASRLAVEAIAQSLARAMRAGSPLRDAVLDGIEQANREVTALGIGAATTVAVLLVEGREVQPVHVGDSALLVVGQRGKIKHQSVPHGPVGYAIEAGLLDESEAMHHAERHLVSNIVGASDMRIEVGPRLRLHSRDTVLVASDGLSDNLYVEEIVERIRKGPLAEAAVTLAADCRSRMEQRVAGQPSHPDDLTFILYRPAA